jgi:hypothetical protein
MCDDSDFQYDAPTSRWQEAHPRAVFGRIAHRRPDFDPGDRHSCLSVISWIDVSDKIEHLYTFIR